MAEYEALLAALRAAYERRGYARYKMNKFEEYDLYSRNKDFLISDGVITFTDGNGKLLALKPDVTLSIVKNTGDGARGTEKLYYNENVFRRAKGGNNYREIVQAGLECIGEVGDYDVYEVVKLAEESLSAIAPSHVLSLSHLGLLSDVLLAVGVPEAGLDRALTLIGGRNLHELSDALGAFGVDGAGKELLFSLLSVRGEVSAAGRRLEALLSGVIPEEKLSPVLDVLSALSGEEKIEADFSVTGNPRYYNGFVFKGYVEGVPDRVLSGGQYDALMKRMKKNARAIGFAVYLDEIEPLLREGRGYDADTVILTGAAPIGAVAREVEKRLAAGEKVYTGQRIPEGLTYRKLLTAEEIAK